MSHEFHFGLGPLELRFVQLEVPLFGWFIFFKAGIDLARDCMIDCRFKVLYVISRIFKLILASTGSQCGLFKICVIGQCFVFPLSFEQRHSGFSLICSFDTLYPI